MIVERLNKALNEALDRPALRSRLEGAGFNVAVPNTAESFSRINAQARDTWSKVIQMRKISLD